jgi:hypothetical protein
MSLARLVGWRMWLHLLRSNGRRRYIFFLFLLKLTQVHIEPEAFLQPTEPPGSRQKNFTVSVFLMDPHRVLDRTANVCLTYTTCDRDVVNTIASRPGLCHLLSERLRKRTVRNDRRSLTNVAQPHTTTTTSKAALSEQSTDMSISIGSTHNPSTESEHHSEA